MPWRFDCRPLLGVLAAALIGLSAPDADALTRTGDGAALRFEAAAALLAQADPVDRQVSGAVKDVLRSIRQSWSTVRWMFAKASSWWGDWLRRGAFSIAVAVAAALADAGLLNAFRTDGLRALVGYVPLMLYVYGRLLFARGVNLAPKLLLLGTLIYGAVRGDLLPDRRLSGRVEDVILIVIATRAFIYACPEELVNQFAARAIGWRRRVAGIQQRSR
jgi:hypothetical protein